MIDNNIKFCREELEMTQKELGKIFNVSDSTIRGWENNYDAMPLKKIVDFCNRYNFSIDFLLGIERKNTIYKNKITLNKSIISHKLKDLRKKHNLTQQEIANILGISRSCYGNYETGINLINSINLYNLCKYYHISIDKFLR